ncbi:MAG: AbrB/MazE/SpoVT family DNA-binding domain-containing protein [Rickettsiales bacterium]
MQTEMSKWGNSAAFRVPADLVRLSGLTIGTKVEIVFEDGYLKIKPLKQKLSRAERLKRLLASYEELGPDEEIDWGPDVGNEIIE